VAAIRNVAEPQGYSGCEQAARDGELEAAAPNALAHIATAALNTLAVRARTGAEPAALDALIDATVDVICGRPA
jgi:TetR/AcrR family transcriptional regulator, copper-responsive repressor